jgi:hypothetical protein
MDHAKRYWQPSDAVRSVVNAALYLGAWASGYTAAQIYYTALTVELGYGYFVTVGNAGLASRVQSDVQLKAFLVAMGLNVLFGLGAWALVRVQLAAARRALAAKERGAAGGVEGRSAAEAISVFVTKWVDSVSDGVTFFSTIILYSVLATAFDFEHSPSSTSAAAPGGGSTSTRRASLLWELLLFSVVVTAGSVGWVVGFEALPRWYYCGRLGRVAPPAGASTTNEIVDDWFIGQWQWLMGFAWWSVGVVLLTDSYLGLYDEPWAWWALTFCTLAGYVVFALGYCRCFRRSTSSSPPSTAPSSRSCCSGLRNRCAQLFRAQPRLGAMLTKGVAWVFGIGCYFSLKRSCALFVTALNLQRVDRGALAAFSLAVTAVCFALLLALELAERRVERLTGAFGAKRLQQAAPTGGGGGGGSGESQRPFVVAVRANKAMLRLTLCYVTGKAWEALAFAFHDAASVEAALFAGIAGEWQLIAGLFALLHTAWELKTQRRHGEAHSAHCVCTVCAPQYYVTDAFHIEASVEEVSCPLSPTDASASTGALTEE